MMKLAGMAACGLVALSCERVPLVAPTGSTITLIPTANVLPVNGSTEIIAVLLEGGSGGTDGATTSGSGTPVHNGTVVTFTTTLGRLEPAETKTEAGRAKVKLIADGRSGTATITAFSGAATESIDVSIGAAAAARLALTASPQSLPGTGGTTTISARVEDEQGNGLGGVPVSFTASRGSLSQPNGLSNEAGVATTVLTTTQEAVVTANAGAATGTVTVTLKPRTTIGVAAPASAVVGVPASFTVTPGSATILTEVVVNFGDGDTARLGGITAATQVVHVYRSQGVRTITATATDSEGGQGSASTQVAVAPLQVNLTVSPSTVQAGTMVTFTATVSTGALIDRYEWGLGDGETRVTSGNVAQKVFATSGVRAVSVRAVPVGEGTAATGLSQVTVQN